VNERIRFPAKSMVGVVEVTTGGETLSNGPAGIRGGNLDEHCHGKGARIRRSRRRRG
jgi:acetamidase/formamidase